MITSVKDETRRCQSAFVIHPSKFKAEATTLPSIHANGNLAVVPGASTSFGGGNGSASQRDSAATGSSEVNLEELVEVLRSSFQDRDELREMVHFELGENLDLIDNHVGFRRSAYLLVEWAERESRLPDLARGALQRKPKNKVLQRICKNLNVHG